MENPSLESLKLSQPPREEEINLEKTLDNHEQNLFTVLFESGLTERLDPRVEKERNEDGEVYLVKLRDGKRLIYRFSDADLEHALYQSQEGFCFHDFENSVNFPIDIRSIIVDEDVSVNRRYVIENVLNQSYEDEEEEY